MYFSPQMSLLCNFCGSKLNKMADVLVCKNGHIITNTLAEKEEGDYEMLGKGKRLRKIKKFTFKNRQFSEQGDLLIILYKIFLEAMEEFNLSTNKFFIYYTGLYKLIRKEDGDRRERCMEIIDKAIRKGELSCTKGYSIYEDECKRLKIEINDENDLEEDITRDNLMPERNVMPTFYDFLCIVYLTKRYEKESKGDILIYEQFVKEMESFEFDKRLLKYYKNNTDKFILQSQFDYSELNVMENRIKMLTDAFICKETIILKNDRFATGVFDDYEENVKSNMRNNFNTDMNVKIKYLYYITNKIGLNKIIKYNDYLLIQFFKKFIYIQNKYRIYIPEIEYSIYIIYYAENYHREKVKDILERICNVFGFRKKFILEKAIEKEKLLQNAETVEKWLKYKRNEEVEYNFSHFKAAKGLIEELLEKYKNK